MSTHGGNGCDRTFYRSGRFATLRVCSSSGSDRTIPPRIETKSVSFPITGMNSKLMNLSYEIELQTGEKLSLPDVIVNSIGAGQWLITITPISTAPQPEPVRDHQAFLNGYAPEDEGLYDDYPTR